MNLIKKFTATVALVALVSGLFTTSIAVAADLEVESANTLANAGIIVDHSDNTALYELSRTVLRQEIAAVARGIAGIDKKSTCDNEFMDVSATNPNTWACYTVEALRDNDLIAKNDYFNPEQNITKAEAIGMMVKAAYGDEYSYDESSDSSWQEQVVDFAVSKGMVDSFSDYDALATRGFVFKAGANGVSEDTTTDADDLICQLLGTCGDDEDTSDSEDMDDTEDTDTNVTLDKDVLVAELSVESPEDGDVAAGAARTKMLGFDVTAGNTDVTLENVELEFSGLGDADNVTQLAVYNGNRKVTRGNKNFSSDDTANLSFERDIVIKAGETKTLFVTATIEEEAANYNQTLRITLTKLEASSVVEGDNIVGSTLQPVKVANIGEVELNSSYISSKINIGDEVKLADFSLKEKSDKEAVEIASMTFDVDGSVDTDDIADLALYANGEEVSADFDIDSSEIYADLSDLVIPQDEKVDFLLKATIIGSVNDTLTLTFEDDAIYAIGAESGVSINVDVTGETLLSDARKIEGSEINVSFDKSDIDQAKPDASDLNIGEIKLSSVSDYTIKKLEITVKNTSSNGKTIEDIVDQLELDNTSEDSVMDLDTNEAVYTFEDIDLSAGDDKSLPITMDIMDDDTINDSNLSVNFKITEIKDYDNNKTYTIGGSNGLNVSDVLSSNSFTAKTFDIKNASVEITGVATNNTEVVIGNGIKTVLYKGKISIGDSDDVVIRDFNLDGAVTSAASIDVEDVISDATLNIGGKTFKGDVDGDQITFDSISATIASGADNVSVLVTGTLKDNDNIVSGDSLQMYVANNGVSFDDSEGNTLTVGAGSTYDVNITNVNNNLTKTILNNKGTFYAGVTTSGDYTDDIDEVVLAGTNSVNLAEIELQADQEDANVKRLTFAITGNGNTSAYSSFNAGKVVVNGTLSSGASAAVKQVVELSAPTALDNVGTLSIDVDGTTVSAATYSALAAAIQAKANVASAVHDTTNNIITVTAQTAGTAFALTNYKINGSTDIRLTVTTTTFNKGATAATSGTKQVITYTFNRNLVTGDVIDFDGNVITGDSIADIVTALNGLITGGTAVATSNTKITITASSVGSATIANDPAVIGVTGSSTTTTNFVDYSDTFTNIRLMDGSSVIADGAVTSYVADAISGTTYITFKDFDLSATDSKLNTLLVADLAKYTTSGSETSAQLGDFSVKVLTSSDTDLFDVEGVNSQEDMTSTLGAVSSDSVAIVPVSVTVSVSNKFGTSQTASIKFNIDKGNNIIDNDDIAISTITMESDANNVSVKNNDNETIFATANVPASDSIGGSYAWETGADLDLSNNDEFEFEISYASYGSRVRIEANGIEYTVDGHTYSITNDKVIDLGTYTE